MTENYTTLDRLEWTMKHFPLSDLISMVKAKPVMSVFDFAQAFSGKHQDAKKSETVMHKDLKSLGTALS